MVGLNRPLSVGAAVLAQVGQFRGVVYYKLTQRATFDTLVVMRSTMHISLPQPLKQWIEMQVQAKGFSTASEFVRDLIRHQHEQEVHARVDLKLLDALGGGPFKPMTPRDWQDLRHKAQERTTARKIQ